jgi:hypothetical protein
MGKAPRDLPPGGVETVSLMVTKDQGPWTKDQGPRTKDNGSKGSKNQGPMGIETLNIFYYQYLRKEFSVTILTTLY